MKLRLLAIAVISLGMVAPVFAQGRGHRMQPARACFYEHGDYQGRSFCLNAGESAGTMPAGFDRTITAIRLYGDAVVTAYRDRNFGGDRWVVDTDVRDTRYVANGAWNDRIRSVRVDLRDDRRDDRASRDYDHDRDRDRDHDRGRDHDRDRDRNDWRNMRAGACFFLDGDFKGQSFCLRPGEQATTMPAGFDNQITAMRVFGDAVVTVYRDRNLRGDHQTYTSTVRDFRFIDGGRWNDRIRSIRVDDRRNASY